MSTVQKYEEVPAQWRSAINRALDSGGTFDELVFIEQDNDELCQFGEVLPSVERKAGHCIVVNSVGQNDDGSLYVEVTYVAPNPSPTGMA